LVGVLRHRNQPHSTALFNDHREHSESRLAKRAVFSLIPLDSAAPMKHRQIGPQEPNGDLKRVGVDSPQRPEANGYVICSKSGLPCNLTAPMLTKSTSSAMVLVQLMPIAPRPSLSERLWNFADRRFVRTLLVAARNASRSSRNPFQVLHIRKRRIF
jgi:hypothetical protein